MMLSLQASLLDLTEAPTVGALSGHVRRVALSRGAWVDVLPAWIGGSRQVFQRLSDSVEWKAERRPMYDRIVDVPRLVCHFGEGAALPDSTLEDARRALDGYYADELGERFVTASMCLYRDGQDSVAWHGDTLGRGATEDTMAAIVSLGEPRRLLLRPRGGGTGMRFELGHGDLLVMGGSCQRTWEHAVPKSKRVVGPRISVQFRAAGVG